MQPAFERRCFLHVGTPKTGSSAIQQFLAENAGVLAAHGYLVPRTGEGSFVLGGHINIARQYLGAKFDAAGMRLEDALEDAQMSDARDLILSSELFVNLSGSALARMRETIVSAGYEPHVVIFLRARLEYAQSLYVQMVKHGLDCGFDEYLAIISRTGEFAVAITHRFDYRPILDEFAGVFGAERLHVNRYAGVAAETAVGRFLSCITQGREPALAFSSLAPPRRVNVTSSFGNVLHELFSNARALTLASGPSPADLADRWFGSAEWPLFEAPFSVLEAEDVFRWTSRFTPDGIALAAGYGVHVPVASHAEPPGGKTAAERGARQRKVIREAARAWHLEGYRDRARTRGRALVPRSEHAL